MNNLPIALAQTAAAPLDAADAGSAQVAYDFARLHGFDDPRLFWIGFGIVVGGLLLFAWRVYRRDTDEQNLFVSGLLLSLRVIALLAAAWFFLGLEKRTDISTTEDAKVVVLVDTSLSMGLSDSDASGIPTGPRRSERVKQALSAEELLPQLRLNNDVLVARFDERYQRIAALDRVLRAAEGSSPPAPDGAATESQDGDTANQETDGGDPAASGSEQDSKYEWLSEFQPIGAESRLGDALRTAMSAATGGHLAAVVVISDGGLNAGAQPDAALQLAEQANVPIYTVGVGSTAQRRNVRVTDLVAPSRAYPNDEFTITGYLQAQGMNQREIDVELHARYVETDDAPTITKQSLQVGGDTAISAIEFTIKPTEPGRVIYTLVAKPPLGDVEPSDDRYEVEVNVVDQELQVLLLASGATREYRFLRSQFYRDKGIEADVLLQSARSDISQDARKILDEFPSDRDELYQYDAIIAFDPDWRELDAVQLDMLEKWVSEEAGGLILIAGPIQTDNWHQSEAHHLLKALYPVEFRRRLAILGDARYGSKTPIPLELTRDARAAEFLQLRQFKHLAGSVWDRFAGVYGYFSVKSAKPTATTYANVADDRETPFMVGQFYGAGRVFYLGSGEMWRLRRIDEGLFEVFYTKLLRHVTEGRLLRGSSRGVLLVERDRYLLGDTIAIRAKLKDEQHRPLTIPSANVRVVKPDGSSHTLQLDAVKDQPGSYLAQLRVQSEGAYRIELVVPGESETLSKRIQVAIPDLERENPVLNEPLLTKIAGSTQALYYANLDSALHGNNALQPLSSQIESKQRVSILRGAPDKDFARQQMYWILGIFCGALGLEWLTRRLCRLA